MDLDGAPKPRFARLGNLNAATIGTAMSVSESLVADAAANSQSSAATLYLADLHQLAQYYQQRGLDNDGLLWPEVCFAQALTAYRFAPPKAKMIDERIHVMIFGGAGTGKSTVANILVGADVAEVNAQAGYTRHPVAFLTSDERDGNILWPRQLGNLARVDAVERSNVDTDSFGYQRLEREVCDPGFLRRHVVWDGPDLTSKDASYYQFRAIEIAALAHACVYVASDERYNDELPTNFLQAMLEAGKWVVVVLTKVAGSDSDELVRLFEEQVAARLRHRDRLLAVIVIPSPPPGRFRELWTEAFDYGHRLRSTIEQATADFATTNREAARSAGEYLRSLQSRLLDPLRRDLGEWQTWIELIRKAANDAVMRFEHDHLDAVYRAPFDDALDGLVSSFELPGNFRVVWQTLEVMRKPVRWLKSLSKWFRPRLLADEIDDDSALDRIRRGLIESLQVECASRKSRHPLWARLRDSLERETSTVIEPAFQKARRQHRQNVEGQLVAATEAIHQSIHRRPKLLAAIRISRTVLDVTVVALVLIYLTHLSVYSLVTVPLALGVIDEAVRLGCRRFVDRHRRRLVKQHRESVREMIRNVYIELLTRMPGVEADAETSLGRTLGSMSALADRIPGELTAMLEEIGPGEDR